MKLIRNIPNGYKLFRSVSVFNHFIKEIEATRNSGDVKKEQELIAYSTGIWVNKVLDLFDVRVHVTGQENIPKDSACVFISNHQGYADIIVLFKALEGKQIGFIAKDALEKVPYFGKWIRSIRGVFIKRGDPREALKSIQNGVDYLKQGFSLVIFPEGTRSRSSKMGEFKAGSFKLATKAKVPVVPITIDGSFGLFETTGVIGSDIDVDVIIHPPIDTASLDRHQTATLAEDVDAIIRSSLEELIKEKEINKNDN